MIFAGETDVLGENLPSATLSTINPTWTDLGANPELRIETTATNRLSHDTAPVSGSSAYRVKYQPCIIFTLVNKPNLVTTESVVGNRSSKTITHLRETTAANPCETVRLCLRSCCLYLVAHLARSWNRKLLQYRIQCKKPPMKMEDIGYTCEDLQILF
jgi:hypothetical protein